MDDTRERVRDMERQLRLWRLMAVGMFGLALALLLRSGHAQTIPGAAVKQQPPRAAGSVLERLPTLRAARPTENVELWVPVGVNLGITADRARFDFGTGEMWSEGDVTISWPIGSQAAERVRLRAHQSRVAMFSGGREGPTHIFVEPLPAVVEAK